VREELQVLERERGVCCDVGEVLAAPRATAAAKVLRAMADTTRLSMLATLRRASQPVCICDFTATFNLSQPTISHHMGKLREAGLVTAQRHGIWTFYSVVAPLPAAAEAVLDAVLDPA